jgi:hypothetical protein
MPALLPRIQPATVVVARGSQTRSIPSFSGAKGWGKERLGPDEAPTRRPQKSQFLGSNQGCIITRINLPPADGTNVGTKYKDNPYFPEGGRKSEQVIDSA